MMRTELKMPRKVLFEHIPKCGGTSVVEYLVAQYSEHKVFRIDGKNPYESVGQFRSLPEWKRMSYDLVLGHGAHRVRKLAHPAAVRFTLFREPVDRIISHYYYVLRSPRHYLYKAIRKNRISLLDYATSDLSAELRNNYVCRFLGISAAEAERDSVASVARAFEMVKEEYDVVGVLENVGETMERLRERAGFHERFGGKKLNVTSGRPNVKEIEQEALNSIAAANYMDVLLYEKIKDDIEKSKY